MTDLSVTAANVVPASNAVITHGTAAVALTAGQPVYESSSGVFSLSDNNSGTAAAKASSGIALNSAAAGQPVAVQRSGDLTIGATLTKGTVYFLSATAGGICPAADLTTGNNVILLGIAKSASVLAVKILDLAITL